MAEGTYNVGKAEILRADIDLETADIRMLLLVGALTFNPDHATITAVLAANTEASGGSYARQALTSETVTQDDANNRANFDCATVDFGALTANTPTAAVIYLHVGADGSNIPISFHDSGFGAAANGAGYTVTTPNDVLRLS